MSQVLQGVWRNMSTIVQCYRLHMQTPNLVLRWVLSSSGALNTRRCAVVDNWLDTGEKGSFMKFKNISQFQMWKSLKCQIQNLYFCNIWLHSRINISFYEKMGSTDEYVWERKREFKLTPLTLPSLGRASQWLDTNPAILSCIGPVSSGLIWQSVVGGLSPFCLCSSDSVGTPPDRGVVYPCDTFKTLGWGIWRKPEKRLGNVKH